MFGVESVTTKQATVVSFLNTETIFAIVLGYEVALYAMYSRHRPVYRYFAKGLEPERRGRGADHVAMDRSFDVAYASDQAGKSHHYIAVRCDHRFQG